MTTHKVTTADVDACIRQNGLYGFSTSDLRQLMREDASQGDSASLIRHAAARQVLVAKLNTASSSAPAPIQKGGTGSALNEYTRLHIELAEMLSSGRLPKAVLKDDYYSLVDTLERINRARRAAGLDEIPFDADER